MTELPGNIQESTTAVKPNSTENGSIFLSDSNEPTPALFLLIAQSLIGSVTIIGNLLLMWVVYNLKNSKLRKTTRLLICYVSASYSIMSLVMIARIFKLPCFLFTAGCSAAGLNVVSGMLFLAYETFIVVKKPCDHQRFVSVNICKVQIATSCLVAICMNVLGFVNRKVTTNSSFCYMSNGQFSASRLIVSLVFYILVLIAAFSMQMCALRAIRKIAPIATPNVTYIPTSQQVTVEPLPGPNTLGNAQNTPIQRSPLHRLLIILLASFLCFVICFLPPLICNVIFAVSDLLEIQVNMKYSIITGLSTLVMINGSLHVLVYFVMSTQIRQGMKMLIRSWLCLG